jgi:starch-binding outer membrane protein, SusD/RagB family
MRSIRHRGGAIAIAVAASVAAAGCDDFLEVGNPNILEAEAIDPDRDGGLFSRSSFQNLIVNVGQLAVYQAWFTNEARVGDTFPTRNEYGRRDILDTNGTHNNPVWRDLQRSIASGEDAIVKLAEAGGINLARAYFTSGYAILLMAETFCQGTVALSPTEPGPPLDVAQMVTMSIERLTSARQLASGLTGAEATGMATATLVGIARAHLLGGNDAAARAAADQVPADFEFNLQHVDDPGNRGRLGNNVWAFSETRISLVVPPEYQAMADAGDPRIEYVATGRISQDGVLPFDRQDKYKGWADPIRLASGLEARYIAAEAGSVDEQLALIAERREFGNQEPFTGTSPDAVLTELMEQKSRDFWLEAKRMGDFRRNPNHVPYIIPPGDNYYKPELGLVGNQTCWPVPDAEKRNNPNF